MDVLLLLVEESKYSDRIRSDLIRGEDDVERPPLRIKSKKKKYVRPRSRTSTISSTTPIGSTRLSFIEDRIRSDRRSKVLEITEEPETYSNPPIDTSRRVSESEALNTSNTEIKFTLRDLKLAQKGVKKISVRELRPIANKWRIDSTLKKNDLLHYIIKEYERRLGVTESSG